MRGRRKEAPEEVADKQDEKLKTEILDAVIGLFNEYGMKFTMDQLAERLHRSKKTIYRIFPDKKRLLDQMVDYVFDSIKVSEREFLVQTDISTVDKLRRVLGAMPGQFETVDFRKLYILKDKYPELYSHVEKRLETGWDLTIALIEQGQREGVIRDFSIPVFRTMMQATLEQFFQRDILIESGMTYQKALTEVVDILMRGIITDGVVTGE
ncbi:MAG: TetR/AcrR family transcriptional regulator [Eubacteriales bacterium]|nr:TetR/AcrR family transcriptional regulator [Eubacteriales bacterium]